MSDAEQYRGTNRGSENVLVQLALAVYSVDRRSGGRMKTVSIHADYSTA